MGNFLPLRAWVSGPTILSRPAYIDRTLSDPSRRAATSHLARPPTARCPMPAETKPDPVFELLDRSRALREKVTTQRAASQKNVEWSRQLHEELRALTDAVFFMSAITRPPWGRE